MIAAGESYVPKRMHAVPGDGSAARYAEREVFFVNGFVRSHFYTCEACPRRRVERSGDDYRNTLPPQCYHPVRRCEWMSLEIL